MATDILSGVERVYNNPSQDEVYIVYFNPDSDSGGSLVTETVSYDLIKKAYERADGNPDVFFWYIAENREPDTFVDADNPVFEEVVKDFNSDSNYWWSDMETLYYLAEGGI
jgi:hypothetical protein